MFTLTKLFGKSGVSRRKTRIRLGLEHLEERETPAVAFVGGWGSSMYQYATDSARAAAPGRPMETMALNFTKVSFDRAALPASDYLLTLEGVKGESSSALP